MNADIRNNENEFLSKINKLNYDKEVKLESEWLADETIYPKNTVLICKSEDGKILNARMADGENTYISLNNVEIIESNDFDSDKSFIGEIASIIANGPYSNIPFERSNWRSKIVGTYNHMKCKICGRSERITLCKDGDDYICKECKFGG